MQLIYRVLADLVVLVHAAYVLWVILGLVLILVGYLRNWSWVRGFWFRITHLAMILIVVFESWIGIVCPLTTWEQALRRRAGETTYRGDFVGHVVHDLLFFEAPPWVFTLAYTCFGLAVVATLVLVPLRGRGGIPLRKAGEFASVSQSESR
jgi:hypothetical protein